MISLLPQQKWQKLVYDVRGIGGYKSLVAHYLKLSTSQLLQELAKFQFIECAESDPTISNGPHCCHFCHYYKNEKCKFSELFPRLVKRLSQTSISHPAFSLS